MREHFSELIGNTALIKLREVSDETGCDIYGKAEFMNPGQSVKDRAALQIIVDAEKNGVLKEGGVIVEGTAGNTGIGLTIIGASKGFRTVIVIPETQSQEKKDALRNAGAELVEVPAVPYSNINNYVRYSQRLANALDAELSMGAFWANQFDNLSNQKAHLETTAPEIFQQTEGKVDAFICSVGTGGTLSGVAKGLRKFKPKIKIALADPHGSALYSYFKDGELASDGGSISEGIGQSRITKNLEGLELDYAYRVSDAEALRVLYSLLLNEGLCVGVSAGINIAGAVRLAKELGKGHTIVTILCDHGMRYQSKIFNLDFLKQNNLPIPQWLVKENSNLPKVME